MPLKPELLAHNRVNYNRYWIVEGKFQKWLEVMSYIIEYGGKKIRMDYV